MSVIIAFKEFYTTKLFNVITLVEKCNEEILYNLSKVINKFEDHSIKYGYEKYEGNYKKYKGLRINYKYNAFGRRIPSKFGSTQMNRELRNILYSTIYDDIDMENSAPKIYKSLII